MVVLSGEIIDPTLPEMNLRYLPAHSWSTDEFGRLHFECSDMPFFRRVGFLSDGVQVEMDKVRAEARECIKLVDQPCADSRCPGLD